MQDQNNKKKIPDDDPYDTLILSGGGINGIITLGALQYMYDHEKLQNIKNYYGTSVGTIISYLLVIGYSPIEILLQIISEKLFDHFKKINIINLTNGSGGFEWQPIDDFLTNLTLAKCEQPMSFEDIYMKYGVKLVFCTYNVSLQKKEYLSYDTNPKLLCTAAIRMSSNLPLIFPRYQYLGNYYIDGAVVDDFPITQVGHDNITFGIRLANSAIPQKPTVPKPTVSEPQLPISLVPENITENDTKDCTVQDSCDESTSDIENIEIPEDNAVLLNIAEGSDDVNSENEFSLQDYIITILSAPLGYHIKVNIDDFNNKKAENNNSEILTIPSKKIAFNFQLSTPDQLEMFSYGYQYIKTSTE